MGASLADQAGEATAAGGRTLAIALGANLGDPLATLPAVRPLLERALNGVALHWRWSPLFRTAPLGGPPGQPPYLNGVAVAQLAGPPARRDPDPLAVLRTLQALEIRFGRERRERWGPRRLDLDLLWCGEEQRQDAELTLPHPRLLERSFVLAPLAAIDPGLIPPGATAPVGELLAALQARAGEGPLPALPGRSDWPE